MNLVLWKTGHLLYVHYISYDNPSRAGYAFPFWLVGGDKIRDLFLKRMSQSLTPRRAVFQFRD